MPHSLNTYQRKRRSAVNTYTVKDLMVPLAEYATVSEDATLYETVMALEKAQEAFDHTRYRHRAILILDRKGRVIGKVSQLDVLKALEPKYNQLLSQTGLAHLGLTREFMKSMLSHFDLLNQPMSDLCSKAAVKKVTEFMVTLSDGEYVEEDAGLNEAIHQLVIGSHQSLLVSRGKAVVGILRLTDVFAAVFAAMKTCGIQS